jgi:hypothetical protein
VEEIYLGVGIDKDNMADHVVSQTLTAEPNPFRPWVKLTFHSKYKNEYPRVKVYNVKGVRVAQLSPLNGWKDSGQLHYQWDGSGFASGTYIAQVRHGGGLLTKRISLLK